MATLEERSSQLMKPAKDLADWNFPFSEVLEEYYTLLEEQRNVNLNKAALVIQNSANTFIRRVEYLYQDTTSLIRAFIDQEAENETKKSTKNAGKEKKTAIDTIDFEPIDFSQYVSKNINIKNRNGSHNSVKLLGQRFPQLENASRSLRPDQPSSTAEGDQEQDNDRDFVRKYPFRCNQYITASGMLVEHLIPEDFSKSSDKKQDLDSIIYEENAELTGDLAGDSVTLANRRLAVSTPLPDTENDFMDSSFVSMVDSGRGSSVRTTNRPESSLSCDRDGTWDSMPQEPCSDLPIGDSSNFVEAVNDSGFENDDAPLNDTSSNKRGADENERSNNFTDPENVSRKSVTPVVEQCRRSKRLRSLFDVESFDSGPLKPIPFETVQDKLPKNRTEFKLPCALSLLKSNQRPHKRKTSAAARKRRSLENFWLKEADMKNTKMTVYSPTKELFFPFMKEELEDLPKCFNKYLRSLRSLETQQNYEAVTNESKNLLGYKRFDRKLDSVETSETMTETCESIAATEIPSSDHDFPMPDTPESVTSPEPTSPVPPDCDSRIERLVHDIYENSDVRSEQEEAVIRWHEDIQLKLKEGKRRPKFDMSEYTARVLKCLKDNNGRMTFERMVCQDKPPEAARYLLASLMLANKYNLRIDSSDDEGNVMLLLLNE